MGRALTDARHTTPGRRFPRLLLWRGHSWGKKGEKLQEPQKGVLPRPRESREEAATPGPILFSSCNSGVLICWKSGAIQQAGVSQSPAL